MDESLIEREISELSKSYSVLRSGSMKWASLKLQSRLKSGLDFEIKEIDKQLVGLVNRPQEGAVIGYKIAVVKCRIQLKRTRVIFLGIYSIWKLVNPFAIKGLSKGLYKDILLSLYRNVFCISEDYPNLPELTSQDLKLDFGDYSALVFSDFYHSLFHCVDSFTKSKLASEYVRVLNKLAEVISNSNWLDSKDLHSRLHITGALPRGYEAWMRPILRDFHAPSVTPLPNKRDDLGLIPSEPVSSQFRASTAPYLNKPKDQLVAKTHFRRIPPLQVSFKPPPPRKKLDQIQSFSPTHTLQSKPSLRFKHLKHLRLIGPLSKTSKRARRESNVLEDVVNRRSRESLGVFSPLETARF